MKISSLLLVCMFAILAVSFTLADEVSLVDNKPINYRNRVLVVIDTAQIKTSHSKLFDELKKAGFSIEFKLAFESITLIKYGENVYDHLLILAPKAKSKFLFISLS